MNLPPDTNRSFGAKHFADAQLGDQRRTKRLVFSADCIARHPGGTLPDKFKSPADLKAFYRLCDCPDVTHETVLAPHRQRTLDSIEQFDGPVLVIHDSTELDYTEHYALNGLGQIGNGSRRGYICHNSLAVDPQRREVLGLLNQVLHCRAKVPKKETAAQRRKRESRESRIWLRGVGVLPKNRQLVDVCDQGADTFEFLERETLSGRRFVIRAAYDRGIFIGHRNNRRSSYLRSYARRVRKLGERIVNVTSQRVLKSPKKSGKKKVHYRQAREATVHVSAAPIQVKRPRVKSGDHGNEPLKLWIVRVWEPDPPDGQEPLEWYLLTNEPVETFDDACRIIGWYECRWVVEEYHKALKTGCGINNPQFETRERLQPAIALLSIVALTLLTLRDASRHPDAKTRAASEMVSKHYIEVLSLWRHRRVFPNWTVHEFFYALARLGGHQNRRHDKQPGWLVLWRGWTTLQAMVDGAAFMKIRKKKCG
jgi:hypothetical protein